MTFSRPAARALATLVALSRTGLGVVAITAPRLPLRPWVGERRHDPTALMLARALGARDLALGLGAVFALQRQAPARAWIGAGGLADAGDVLATLSAWRHLPPAGRWTVLAAAGSGALAAAVATTGVDQRD